MLNMKERLQQLLTKEQLTPVRFAEIVGVQRSSVSHLLSGRNNPSLDFIQKILLKFPQISSDWLINGIGDIYRNHAQRQAKTPELFDQSKEEDQPAYHSKTVKTEPPAQEKPVIEPSHISASDKSNSFANKTLAANDATKQVDRIIVFYKDRSFREYHPE